MLRWSLLLLSGCIYVGEGAYDQNVRDLDGDGGISTRFGGPDCVDEDPTIADCDVDGDGELNAATPDGTDCDDTDADRNSQTIWLEDLDGDSYGSTQQVQQCTQPPGFVQRPGDCDDSSPSINPAASEACDDLDRNCDGFTQRGAAGAEALWPDADGDGFGDQTVADELRCPEAGFVSQGGDCNDADPTVFGPEVCDGIDNDCDGLVDDADPGVDEDTAPTLYRDVDGDGFGAGLGVAFCSPEPGWVSSDGDCDDDFADVNPIADEVCDSRDNNCDGLIDIASTDAQTFYVDADGDGHGVVPVRSCVIQPGMSPLDDDCDDGNATIYPGAPEVCGDAVRQDCQVAAADDCDADGEPAGADCDDTNPLINSTAPETCDGRDNDCDNLIDAADPDVTGPGAVYFVDADGDGYGSTAVAGSSMPTCDAPLNSVSNSDDCDDGDPNVRPLANEFCDGVDNDCDGNTDESPVVSPPTFYRDADEDGHGDPLAVVTVGCTAPDLTGWSDSAAMADDCDDSDADIFGNGNEVCDGKDNDCNGLTDEDDPAVDLPTWFLDNDADGFGQETVALEACAQPDGYAALGGDCNDNDFSSQDALEWFPDGDGDGYGEQGGASVQACGQPPNFVRFDFDCDDAMASVNPAAQEECNGIDDDCDDEIDNATTFGVPLFVDSDGDGFGVDDLGTTFLGCPDEPGYADVAGDCDDIDPNSNPAGVEECDSADRDCSGFTSDVGVDASTSLARYTDGDGDGFGTGSLVYVCEETGVSAVDGDCDDTEIGIAPGVEEVCNSIDDNCDGVFDEPSLVMTSGRLEGFDDRDLDGFGGATTDLFYCVYPVGVVGNDSDCEDADGTAFPGAVERCDDGVDNNCDGDIDEGCTWYADVDGDGFGNTDSVWPYATPPSSGYVTNDVDCDDTAFHIGAVNSTVLYPSPFVPAGDTMSDVAGAMCPGMTLQLTADVAEGVLVNQDIRVVGASVAGPRFEMMLDGTDQVLLFNGATLQDVTVRSESTHEAVSIVAADALLRRVMVTDNLSNEALVVNGDTTISTAWFDRNDAPTGSGVIRVSEGSLTASSLFFTANLYGNQALVQVGSGTSATFVALQSRDNTGDDDGAVFDVRGTLTATGVLARDEDGGLLKSTGTATLSYVTFTTDVANPWAATTSPWTLDHSIIVARAPAAATVVGALGTDTNLFSTLAAPLGASNTTDHVPFVRFGPGVLPTRMDLHLYPGFYAEPLGFHERNGSGNFGYFDDENTDGVPDGWFSNWTNGTPIVTDDTDGDGLNLLEEYLYGGDPSGSLSSDTDRNGVLDGDQVFSMNQRADNGQPLP